MKTEYKVGDKLRVRCWEDISNPAFTTPMRKLCGLPFTVSEIDRYGWFYSEEGVEKRGSESDFAGCWAITADMLEYDEPSFEPISEEELNSLPGF